MKTDYRNITLEEAKKLPIPGIYPGIPSRIYHQLDYLGSSTIKAFESNPSTCHDPVTGIPPVGEASHCYSLEGKDEFHTLYTVMPEFPCPPGQNERGWHNTNLYKGKVGDFLLENAGKICLTAEEGRAVLEMDKNLKAHPVTRKILNRGANELTVFWIDPGTGLKCKARIDDYPGNGIANDLKTTNSLASFIGIYKRLHYSTQGGMYTQGLEANGENIRAFIVCAVEFNEPFGVRAGRIGMPEDETQIDRLQAAKDNVTRLLSLYKECLDGDCFKDFNYPIPKHIYSIGQIQDHDLLEDWNGLEGRFM